MAIALILLPLLGVLPIAFLPAERAKWIATIATALAFVVSIIAAVQFTGWSDGSYGFLTEISWLSSLGVTLNMHADSVSMMLILLTTFLMPICIIGSFSAVTTRQKEYYAWLLVLQAAMTGVFFAKDLIFFYICFEFTLVPMFFLIAIFGGDNRAAASVKFFLYTFTGSLITLAALLWTASNFASSDGGSWAMAFDIPTLTAHARTLPLAVQSWLLLGLMAGFAVKVPLFPVHTWLPLAHTEAPTAGSVILAGVLLKLGTYGIYRFILPMLPEAVVAYAPAIGVLAVIAIIYAALICWVQDDVKKLVAYSSVSHLGFCVLGLFALNPMGLQGSVLYMINHGLSTGALFLMIGMMYERYHTRDMNRIGGLAKKMPIWATFMVFFVLSSVGLPGLNGFVSEFLCLIAAFTATGDPGLAYPGMLGPWFAVFAGLGMIFAAMYLLIMTGKVVFGPLKEPSTDGHGHGEDDAHGGLPVDLNLREISLLVPLAVLCVVLGLKPGILMGPLEPATEAVLVDSGYPAAVRARLELLESRSESEAEPVMAADAETDAVDPAPAVIAAVPTMNDTTPIAPTEDGLDG